MAKDEILEWCKGRPAWQQEAIRLLAGQGALEPGQIEELAQAVKVSAENREIGGTVPVSPRLPRRISESNAQLAPVTLFGRSAP